MRAYKNKKYNKVNYVNYGKNPKYFGLQASRYPGSIKRQFCNTHAGYYGMGGPDITITVRRSPAVYKGSACVEFFDPTPELGPTLEASIVPPVSGPSYLETVSAPTVGPSALSSSIAGPATGPTNISFQIIAPQAGPQSVTSAFAYPPVAGPTSLSGNSFNTYDQTQLTDFDLTTYFGAVVVTGHGAANGFYQGHIISGNYIWKRVALLNCTDSPTYNGGHSAQISYTPTFVGSDYVTPGKFIVATLDGGYSYTHNIALSPYPDHLVTVVSGVGAYLESVHGCGNGTYPT